MEIWFNCLYGVFMLSKLRMSYCKALMSFAKHVFEWHILRLICLSCSNGYHFSLAIAFLLITSQVNNNF